ncbi:unnamed protein product [Didymodactylos carnosus]|uniref:NHL repeat containing protein n=1 Tax=Didymodactylos carnosus TaxID=1234261 RepID=A0A816BKR4_9BILA|nr:unnamed protein product [Didymodactylos carnosus]CAF4495592.1 unnamed protein product [Didymodactylos carnosus]
MKWSVNSTTGTLVAGGNGQGTGTNQLSWGQGIYVDSDLSVYVANNNAHNVIKWLWGASLGTVVAGSSSGAPGSTSTLLKNPCSLILDAYSNLYVVDNNNHRIQMFCPGSTNGTTVAGTGSQGSSATTLNYPCGIAFDSQLNMYVADTSNHRIQKFMKL